MQPQLGPQACAFDAFSDARAGELKIASVTEADTSFRTTSNMQAEGARGIARIVHQTTTMTYFRSLLVAAAAASAAADKWCVWLHRCCEELAVSSVSASAAATEPPYHASCCAAASSHNPQPPTTIHLQGRDHLRLAQVGAASA